MENVVYCINAINDDDADSLVIDSPNHCPCCSKGILPIHVSSYYRSKGKSIRPGESVLTWNTYLCPNCDLFFTKSVVAEYRCHGNGSWCFVEFPRTAKIYPYTSITTEFSEYVRTLSPSFVKIYGQAETAESQGLDEICGVGYRKSLEFLVKDYLCSKQPESEEQIKDIPLGKAIARIESTKIQTLASRATWIGNDETHYVRKHESLDVEKMKAFIRAMVSFIEDDLAFEEALAIQGK